ncbi:High potential iron-sulfur protein [Ectothiorhodospira magna]|uniref:High-potential iron-sulfur protein n=1 Tax=Ectothiorhodospira magna TaxID=867345 RepID=A0A1H9DRB0_9GAMM|nr:high-potential iron-sulfur protein [Ectothiorhodospira magna]SEQ15253.1 High potential iron-sulfur protein [Ectothiorhodospira magna]
MTDRDNNLSRRRFLKLGSYGLLAVPAVAGLGWSTAAQAMERLSEDDPAAQALNYVHDASAAAGHPAYEEGQNCLNCLLYTDASAMDWGPCTVFPNLLVAAEGWCTAWVSR